MSVTLITDEQSVTNALSALRDAQAKLAEALVGVARAQNTLVMMETNLRSGALMRATTMRDATQTYSNEAQLAGYREGRYD